MDKNKRVCRMSTPEAIKNQISLRSRRNASKCLAANFAEPPASLKVTGVSKPFMERMFVSRLESIRVKLGVAPDISSVVIRCYKYDPHNGGSVYVEFISQDICNEIAIKAAGERFLNSTLGFENFHNLDVSTIPVEEERVMHFMDDDELNAMVITPHSPVPHFSSLDTQDIMDAKPYLGEEEVPESKQSSSHESQIIQDDDVQNVHTDAGVYAETTIVEEVLESRHSSTHEHLHVQRDVYAEATFVEKVQESELNVKVTTHTTTPVTNTGTGVKKLSFNQQCENIIVIDKDVSNLKPTEFVNVTNLPRKLYLEHFQDFVSEEVRTILGLQDDEKVLKEASICPDNSVRLEFTSVEVAAACCLIEEKYNKNKLSFNQQFENVMIIDQSVSNSKPTKFVNVTNLPRKLHLEHFQDFVSEEVRTILGLEESEVVLKAATICPDNSVRLEFTSVELAAACCLIEEKYDKNKVSFNHQFENMILIDKDVTILKPTEFVNATNLPRKLYLEHFQDFVSEEVRTILGLEESEVVLKAATICPDNSVRLEFTSVEVAAACCLIEEKYDKNKVSFNQQLISIKSVDNIDEIDQSVKEGQDINPRDAPYSNNSLLISELPQGFDPEYLKFVIMQKIFQVTQIDMSIVVGEIEACESCGPTSAVVKFSSEKHMSIFLDTKLQFGNKLVSCNQCPKTFEVVGEKIELEVPGEGDVVFLRLLCRHRRKFEGRNHSSGYAAIIADLQSEGYKSSIPKLNKFRKSFLDKYNAAKKKNKEFGSYWDVLSVIFGTASPDILEGTKFSVSVNAAQLRTDSLGVAASSSSFIGGACFNIQSSKALLSIMRVNMDEFRNAKNTDMFWREVKRIMKDRYNYDFPSHRCESRYADIVAMYKTEVQRLQGTGIRKGPEPWFWKDMESLEGNNVAVRNALTSACGSSYIIKKTIVNSDDEDENGTEDSSLRIGKGRVSQLRRPLSKKKENENAFMAMAKQMAIRNELLMKKLNKELNDD